VIPGVDVASLRNVSEKRGVPKVRDGLPVPLPRVPREILDKPSFEDPEYRSLLVCGLQLFGDSKIRLGAFLRENPNREVRAGGNGDYLIRDGLNAPFGRHSLEFDHSCLARSCVDDVVDPFKGGGRSKVRDH
jgi:hypothetical protein